MLLQRSRAKTTSFWSLWVKNGVVLNKCVLHFIMTRGSFAYQERQLLLCLECFLSVLIVSLGRIFTHDLFSTLSVDFLIFLSKKKSRNKID